MRGPGLHPAGYLHPPLHPTQVIVATAVFTKWVQSADFLRNIHTHKEETLKRSRKELQREVCRFCPSLHPSVRGSHTAVANSPGRGTTWRECL
jgi:hypothetical protein